MCRCLCKDKGRCCLIFTVKRHVLIVKRKVYLFHKIDKPKKALSFLLLLLLLLLLLPLLLRLRLRLRLRRRPQLLLVLLLLLTIVHSLRLLLGWSILPEAAVQKQAYESTLVDCTWYCSQFCDALTTGGGKQDRMKRPAEYRASRGR